MSRDRLVRPKIALLTHSQMKQVHDYSVKILSTTGIRVDSEKARSVLAQCIGPKFVSDDRVYIPREIVEWALNAAPSQVNVYDRRGNHAFCLGQDRTRFGIGVTVLYYQDPITDELEKFSRKHMEAMVRLGHALPNYDVISTVGIIQDWPPEVADLVAVLEMVANTNKPLVVLVSEEKLFAAALDLLEQLVGNLSSRPFVIPYLNPVTPLVVNTGTAHKMLVAIERGLPVIYSNYSMAGMSSPMMPAGNLALLNAELLAGLVLSQLAKEGTPIILGSLPNYFDMKTMVSFYDPRSILMSLACAEMMTYYGLPHCGTSGGASGWGPDLQAADTIWMNQITSCLGGAGLAPFVGDTLGAKAFSPVSVVYGHEVITQALSLAEGFVLDDASVALDEIDGVGPGGHFLIAGQTLEHHRTAYYDSPIFPRWSMERWLTEGRPRADRLLREYTWELLNRLEAPDDHDDLLAQGESFIRSRQTT